MMVATDLASGKKVVLKSGNIGVKEKIEDIKKLLESA